MRRGFTIAVLAGLLFITGCATYQYDVVQPPSLARHIGDRPLVVRFDPLEYVLQSYDNHLVIDIRNPTPDPVQLLGEQSVVVDEHGQSHPLHGQTIAPGTFIRLIFPPFRYVWRDEGPEIIIGGGFWYGGGYYRDRPRYIGPEVHPDRVLRGSIDAASPVYLDYEFVGDPTYFEWDGETDIRLTLVYNQTGRQFVQTFVFHRQKM